MVSLLKKLTTAVKGRQFNIYSKLLTRNIKKVLQLTESNEKGQWIKDSTIEKIINFSLIHVRKMCAVTMDKKIQATLSCIVKNAQFNEVRSTILHDYVLYSSQINEQTIDISHTPVSIRASARASSVCGTCMFI